MKNLVLASACVLGISVTPAFAESSAECLADLSDERMTFVVPNAPGGGYDTYARALAPSLEKHGGFSVRVVNMPAGGGRSARSLVLNSDPDDLLLILENTSDLVTTEMGDFSNEPRPDRPYLVDGFEILGILHIATNAWLGQKGFDVTSPDNGPIIASEGGIEEALLAVFVTGMALGVETDIVTGYDGSSDQASAVLRGEVDMTSMSITSALRLAQDEGLDVVLSLSNGPSPEAPDVPYLAGEGSVVWQLTEDLDPEEASKRRNLAQAVANLRNAARGIFVSRSVPEARRACISDALAAAMEDPQFVEAAVSQGRPVEVLDAQSSQDFVASMRTSMVNLKPLFDEVLAARMGQ